MFITIILHTCHLLVFPFFVPFAEAIEVPSSFHPLGSGARALAMGGAYMNMCGDGTAASWNPACLVRVKDYELALVYSFVHRKEDNYFSKKSGLSNVGKISQSDLNFAGVVIPFKWGRQMAFSMSIQNLYDMSREWDFWDNQFLTEKAYQSDRWNYRQKGGLTAISMAYGVQLNTQLTLGMSLKFWDNSLSENKWQQRYVNKGILTYEGTELSRWEYHQTEDYQFKGTNFNIGMLYRFNSRFYAGGIIKTPFNADIDYQRNELYMDESGQYPDSESKNYDLDMPLSYGVGFMYHPTDRFRISFDAYCTRWDQFVLTDADGTERFPLTNDVMQDMDINATYQFRLGTEYLWAYNDYIIPMRMGLMYDPVPSDGKPDEFFGLTVGTGLTKNHCYSIDIAYQYRKGNDVQIVDLDHLGFSQDVSEHSLYLSVIYYWQGNYWDDEN